MEFHFLSCIEVKKHCVNAFSIEAAAETTTTVLVLPLFLILIYLAMIFKTVSTTFFLITTLPGRQALSV